MDWVGALKGVLGDGWLFFAAVVIYLIANSGLVPKWLGERRGAHARERAAVNEDRRALIDNYEDEADNQRRWRAEDAERFERERAAYDARLAQKDDIIAKLAATTESSERGNSRLRHALNNILHVIVNANDMAIRRGEKPPFVTDGLRNLFGLSDDLDEQLHKLLGEVPPRPPGVPPLPGSTC